MHVRLPLFAPPSASTAVADKEFAAEELLLLEDPPCCTVPAPGTRPAEPKELLPNELFWLIAPRELLRPMEAAPIDPKDVSPPTSSRNECALEVSI